MGVDLGERKNGAIGGRIIGDGDIGELTAFGAHFKNGRFLAIR